MSTAQNLELSIFKPLSIKRVLVANRGEICMRIVRTLQEMGIETVAVYSAADRTAPYIEKVDYAVFIGEALAAKSYLDGSKIIDAAKSTGADAIHPGYGFLSENADFAAAVIDAGLTFIGPSPESMRVMGSKVAARKAMQQAGVCLVPGHEGALKDIDDAVEVAENIGYPIMLKASAGGGGKGMRRVDSQNELQGAFASAASEATNAFGDGRLFIEKLIIEPRHIEVQVFADSHGHTVVLGERECSMQRRHQKVIEESPATRLSPKTRQALYAEAIKVAQAVDYMGAGTVEFLVDGDGQVFFLEMNTRLQVEHAVTEECFGVDLVAAQVEVAAGCQLPWTQEQLSSRGHSIEMRIYAENPLQDFMPAPGTITQFYQPAGLGVRVDSGVISGSEVTRFYDPMIAKIIVWGRDREQAVARSLRALEETRLSGIFNNIQFLYDIIADQPFMSGCYHTGTIPEYCHVQYGQKVEPEATQDKRLQAALIAALAAVKEQGMSKDCTLTISETDGEVGTVSASRWSANAHVWSAP